MAGFVPVAKNLGEAIGYSALDLSRNITPGKVAASKLLESEELH